MYVSDIIGEKYKTWKKGDIILLTAPTGSGKTFFILNELLPHAIDERKKILYLVNRRVLKEQLSVDINKRRGDLSREKNLGLNSLDEYIIITTYQSIEHSLKSNTPNNTIHWIETFDYVVCDECHYFLNDSNFNTYTELSFDCIRTHFNYKIQIYMSATIDNTVYFIKNRVSRLLCPEMPYDVCTNRYIEYNIPRDYEYVKLKFFNNQEELKQIIISNKDSKKWLIFTDSIASGKELRNYLVEYLKKEDSFSKNLDSPIGFIDAKFDDDLQGTEIYDEIATKEKTSKRILIATAVIDNGISLKDYDLRNIAIMADTEESFVQMLGRKRPDGQDVTVYICKRDEGYFKRRLQYIDSILKLYDDICFNYKYMYGQTESNGHIFPYYTCEINHIYFPGVIQSVNYNTFRQSTVLDNIFLSTRNYNYAKKICYNLRGHIAINNFAVHKCILLKKFYTDIISELQQDENAFIRKQASWLGKDDSEIEAAINESTADLDELHRNKFNTIIKQHLNNNLDREGNGKITGQLKEEFRYFLNKFSPVNEEEIEIKKTIDDTVSKKRALKPSYFNKIMELAELPYIMEKPNGSTFIIKSK